MGLHPKKPFVKGRSFSAVTGRGSSVPGAQPYLTLDISPSNIYLHYIRRTGNSIDHQGHEMNCRTYHLSDPRLLPQLALMYKCLISPTSIPLPCPVSAWPPSATSHVISLLTGDLGNGKGGTSDEFLPPRRSQPPILTGKSTAQPMAASLSAIRGRQSERGHR